MAAQSFHLQIISIPVKNVERAVTWYREMFGLDFCFPFQEGDDEALLNLNGMGFGLYRSSEVLKMDFTNAKGERLPILTFQVDNIHELHAEMANKGANVKEMVFKPGGGHNFQFVDPDGNYLGIWGGWPKEVI
jgi:predicted enzyme related to lactoylglutathione lyase